MLSRKQILAQNTYNYDVLLMVAERLNQVRHHEPSIPLYRLRLCLLLGIQAVTRILNSQHIASQLETHRAHQLVTRTDILGVAMKVDDDLGWHPVLQTQPFGITTTTTSLLGLLRIFVTDRESCSLASIYWRAAAFVESSMSAAEMSIVQQ